MTILCSRKKAARTRWSARRGEYFPVYYAEPFANGNQKILGFDVASDPGRGESLRRSGETRQPAATSRVHLIQVSDKNADGIVFYEPVVKKVTGGGGKEYEHIIGFIGSVVPLEAMIDAAIKPLSYVGVNIVIHDLSAEEDDKRLLYVRSTRIKQIPREEILEDYRNQGFLAETKVIDVGGRKWQITVLPARGYFPMTIHKSACVILLGGLLFTCLLAVYMISRIREREKIAREVEARTEELSRAKRETEMILLSTHEGIIGLDRGGSITFCNSTAGQLLGYGKKDLIGQNHHALVHHKRPDGSAYDFETCPIHHVLEYGSSCNVRDEVFWRRCGDPVQVEYTGSPIFEGGEVTGAVLVFRDIAERRALEKKLEQMARYDQLTLLANRTLFIEHLKNAIARAERTGKKVGVIYLDLNGFKPINDTLGHAAGDLMLKKFADCLREVVRDADVAARMGGDEFTILADNLAKEEECLKLVDRLLARLEKPFEISGQEFNIGASIGIAFYPDHADNHEDLISRADTAMYDAKSDKNLPLVIYSPVKKAANKR